MILMVSKLIDEFQRATHLQFKERIFLLVSLDQHDNILKINTSTFSEQNKIQDILPCLEQIHEIQNNAIKEKKKTSDLKTETRNKISVVK